jgi:hypothetical protein
MQVLCFIKEIKLENEYGDLIDSVRATCSRCEHVAEAFGTAPRSVRRCLITLREECPEGEDNFYVAEDGEDED